MPIKVQHELKPTLIVKPDMRFANTFLSTKYRDYSVPGEALMDKVSGELFMKRPIDGRVISFYQNKKMLHDLTLELRVLLTNNESIYYPFENENAFFVSTNYDLVTINNENIYNLITDDIVISDTGDSMNTLSFNLSSDSNGFFCRPTTRDCDKPLVEFLVNKYNTFFKNYDGDNETFIAEKQKFEDINLWEDSSCELVFTASKYKNDNKTDQISISYPVRVNESSGVKLPYSFTGNRDYDYIKIQITNIKFYKVHFMIDNKDLFDSDFITNYNKFLFNDEAIEPAELNVMHFVDDLNQITLLGNEFLVALLDIPYINRYMAKMSKLKAASQFLTTIDQPNDTEWTANTCWAERIRDVLPEGETIDTPARNSFEDIESYFTYDSTVIHGNIVLDPLLIEDFLLIDMG